MTSADSCTFSASSQMRLPLSRHFAQVSPGTTRFFLSIHLPHLSPVIPCSYWASACIAVLPSRKTLYVISVRQTGDLPVVSLFPHPASFRSHLTVDTLAFGYILPTAGRIRDSHPLETCAARRTTIKNRTFPRPVLLFSLFARPKEHFPEQFSGKLFSVYFYELIRAGTAV